MGREEGAKLNGKWQFIQRPLGVVQWKRASSRVDAGTSGFLSVSDSDPMVPAE